MAMRICYVLLSPTFGMHQYTANLVNRMALAGNEVHLVTTSRYPGDRYLPGITVHKPVEARNTGFSPDALRPAAIRKTQGVIVNIRPDVVHLTGPHLWNLPVLRAMRRAGVPAVHTLHDLHPHAGAVYGRLLYLWNGWVRRGADHLLVHGERFRGELLAQGVAASRVTCTLLTHLFVGYEAERLLEVSPPAVEYEPWALFVGRLLPYKGLGTLVEAAQRVEGQGVGVVVAGPGRLARLIDGPVPANVEVRERLIGDGEAADLFARCGVMVLPYVEASQSALVAAAYFFRKPVIVTRTGALPEYVIDGETGWVVAPGDAELLAGSLRAALGDPERLARMGRAGRAWYERAREREMQALERMYGKVARGAGLA